MRDVSYTIGGETVTFQVDGETSYGPDKFLLDRDDDLTADAPWHADGFTVSPFVGEEDRRALRDGVTRAVAAMLAEAGVRVDAGFELPRYHECLDADGRAHAHVVERIRKFFQLGELPIDVAKVERRVSEIMGVNVAAGFPSGEPVPYFLRVIRPRSGDNNPPQRDVWLDHLRHAINLYAPLAGSNELSSLPIVPGSHLWRESAIERTQKGAVVNGVPYTVPAVVGAKRPLHLVRPNPREDQILLFSPYLIHGGGANLNADVTRVSLEMRFFRVR